MSKLQDWQIEHNRKLDAEILKNEEEHIAYIKDCEEKRKRFMEENPDHPYAHLFFLPVKAKRMVAG